MTFRIFFRDLTEEAQLALWEEVRAMLLAADWLEPRQEGEGWEAFEQRVYEAVDHYLNCHNSFEITL